MENEPGRLLLDLFEGRKLPDVDEQRYLQDAKEQIQALLDRRGGYRIAEIQPKSFKMQ